MAAIQIPFPDTIDPAHRQVAMEDPVLLPNGEYEQVQKFDIRDSEPSAMKVSVSGQTVEHLINGLPSHMMDFLHWGNLSKAGVQFSDDFIQRHADRLDWNMMSLYAPLSSTAAVTHKRRLIPHMLMKNPNLNDAVLSAVADILDLDRVVRELKISSDFAARNMDVLNLDDLIKYQKLSDSFWIDVLRMYQTSPVKLIDLANRITATQELGMEFVTGIQNITTEVNVYLQKNPIPGINLPVRILDGATLIRRAKMDHPFIISILQHEYPPERKREIKQQMVAYQNLSAEIIQQFYNSQEDLADEELCYQILSRQPVSAEYLSSQAERILSIPRFRIAVATRQSLTGPQVESLLAAAEPAQRGVLINTIVLRCLRDRADPRALELPAEMYGKLAPNADWNIISNASLNRDQALNLLRREPGRICWREFMASNRKNLTEADIDELNEHGVIGPLEWILILTAEDKNRKLVRLTPANSLGIYTADFLSKHLHRFDWWKYVDATRVPYSMMNKYIEATDSSLAHLRRQCDAILQVFVATADWPHLLRYEELPLWFLDGMSRYAERPEMNRGASFWWKVSMYQPLYRNPRFIDEHAAVLDLQMIVKQQLHKMWALDPTAATRFIREYMGFFEDDTTEFIMKNRDLSPLLQAINAEQANAPNPVPQIATASVAPSTELPVTMDT